MTIENNYWQQGDKDGSTRNVTERDNHLIHALSEGPAETMEHAGIEPAARHVLERQFDRQTAPDPPSRVAVAAMDGTAWVVEPIGVRRRCAGGIVYGDGFDGGSRHHRSSDLSYVRVLESGGCGERQTGHIHGYGAEREWRQRAINAIASCDSGRPQCRKWARRSELRRR